jgi:hypothetical protein
VRVAGTPGRPPNDERPAYQEPERHALGETGGHLKRWRPVAIPTPGLQVVIEGIPVAAEQQHITQQRHRCPKIADDSAID